MKLRTLLPAIAVAVSAQGFAAVPLHFRDCVNIMQGGGHMDWPCVEGTREIDPETGAWLTHGDPLFAEDGSITLTPVQDIAPGDGMYFRTTKLGTYLDEPVPSEYMFLALDYKSNMAAADMFVFYHEMGNWVSFTNFYPVVPTEEYATVYMILTRTTPADWAVQPGEEWGNNSNWKNNYMWIGWNDPAVKTPDFHFTVKNIRMLTAAEVIGEIQNAPAPKGPICDVMNGMNIGSDFDEEMGEKVYALAGSNNLFQTRCQQGILPKDHSIFKFEYKAAGNADAPVFWTVQGGGLTGNVVGEPLTVVEDPYAAGWSTYTIDLAGLIETTNFAQTPFSNDYLYIQFQNSDGNLMYVKNPRWESLATEPEQPQSTLGFPAYFRDAVNMAPDGGGHMDWPSNDRVYDEETGAVISWGTPAFEADGSITLRPNDGCIGGGLYFRTTKLKTYDDPKPIPADKVIFAFDYKSNKTASDMVFFHHEGGGISIANGNMIEITGDKWATTYMILNERGNWASEEDENWGDRYAWVSWNDPNVHDLDWELTIKNLRYLSMAEASEECAAVEGDIADNLVPANSDIVRDFDTEMDGGCAVYSRAQDVPNPVLKTNNNIKPLPSADTHFMFEYKLVGAGEFAPRFHAVQAGTYSAHFTDAPKLIPLAADADAYEAEWKTYDMDFTALRSAEGQNFANVFGSNDQLHVQLIEMNEDDVLWIRNVRWAPGQTGIESIIADEDCSNAPVIYYNLMGAPVKNPSGGVYIRCQGNKAQKVYVK